MSTNWFTQPAYEILHQKISSYANSNQINILTYIHINIIPAAGVFNIDEPVNFLNCKTALGLEGIIANLQSKVTAVKGTPCVNYFARWTFNELYFSRIFILVYCVWCEWFKLVNLTL